MTCRMLIVDDDESILESLEERFKARGFVVDVARDGREALIKARTEPDIVLLDLQLPDGDGIEVLTQIRAQDIDTKVIVITAYGTVEKAVDAMRLGAYDFLQKPFEPSLAESAIKRALETRRLKRENLALRSQLTPHQLVSVDDKMQSIIQTLRKAASSASTIVLLGESGTGKEVLARQIHEWSPRHGGPFIAINCVALPETLLESELFGHEKGAFTGASERRLGKIELAQGGTLFLDEIGDISTAFQAKILRVLQERTLERVGGNKAIHVDVRVVAATHRDLKKEVEEGRFREDLFYRLHVISAKIPPLRDRVSDVRALTEHFARILCAEIGKSPMSITEEFHTAMESHSWPGNARELRNAVERALVLCEGDELTAEDLPPEVFESGRQDRPSSHPQGGFHHQVESARRDILKGALDDCAGNQTKAAEQLGLQRTYLVRLIRKYTL